MRRYWEIDQTFAQPSESLLKKNLKESVKKQKEKGNKLEPVVISGRTIAKSWWGKAWCDNLERYADFASRLERGKRYVRTGTVIDLKIQKGKIIARVQGTRKTPYRVEIRISPLTEKKCEAILERCGKIETLERLLSGDFPDEMKELFQGEDGLFPQPSEISFQCSCPDWAWMRSISAVPTPSSRIVSRTSFSASRAIFVIFRSVISIDSLRILSQEDASTSLYVQLL